MGKDKARHIKFQDTADKKDSNGFGAGTEVYLKKLWNQIYLWSSGR
jgi:hypothetical protein